MKLVVPRQLRKAKKGEAKAGHKYTRRERGADGRWRYTYDEPTPTHAARGTATLGADRLHVFAQPTGKKPIFIRFITDAAHAVTDFERGHSYRSYSVFSSVDDAIDSDFVQHYGVDPDTITRWPEGSAWADQYGFALDGLCGFETGAITIDEAIDEARARTSLRASNYGPDAQSHIAFYEGDYLDEADAQDGDVFRPTKLLAVGPTTEMRSSR